jgi:hypothetical protein
VSASGSHCSRSQWFREPPHTQAIGAESSAAPDHKVGCRGMQEYSTLKAVRRPTSIFGDEPSKEPTPIRDPRVPHLSCRSHLGAPRKEGVVSQLRRVDPIRRPGPQQLVLPLWRKPHLHKDLPENEKLRQRLRCEVGPAVLKP